MCRALICGIIAAMAAGHLYTIHWPRSGHIYAGKTIEDDPQARFKAHLSSCERGTHCNGYFQDTYTKYKERGQMPVFTVVRSGIPTADLNGAEIALIADTRAKHGVKCINLKDGGEGCRPDLVHRMIICQSNRNRPVSDATRSKIREAAIRRNADPAYRHKLSAVQKRCFATPERQRKHREAMQRRSQNPDWRRKHRAACNDPERNRKISEAKLGERSHFAKLTEADVRGIHELRADGLTHQAIADGVGVGRTAITRILNGTRWPHIHQQYNT